MSVKINKTNKSLAGLMKQNIAKTQITKTRNESEIITINLTHIKMITSEYYEKLCAKKLDSLDKVNKLLGRHKLPKLTQEKIKHLNRPITSKD